MESIRAALKLLKLDALMGISTGSSAVTIGIIDGPVDLNHPAFSTASLRTITPAQLAMCRNVAGGACLHGTAVAGILCAGRGAPAPAISPDCKFLLRPIFSDESSDSGNIPTSTPRELSRAIIQTVNAGANIINLSLGVITSDITTYPELDEAVDYACKNGAILVAAAGNQGRIGIQPLLRRPWVIPVAACDVNGLIAPESNSGLSIGARGLCAPGVNISTSVPGGGYSRMSGTSVAAAFVTGGLALLWSMFPDSSGAELRHCALEASKGDRRSIIPPLFNVEKARQLVRTTQTHREFTMDETRQGEAIETREGEPAALQPQSRRISEDVRAAIPAPHVRGHVSVKSQVGDASCPTCLTGGPEGGAASYIYALGTVKSRFPSLGVEKEFTQSVAGGQTANLSDDQVLYKGIKENRHLAAEMCWVFSIEGIDTYVLLPRDSSMREDFIEAVKPTTKSLDIDVIIGIRGPMAPPEMCNGLVVPIVVVDRLYSFDRPALVKAIPKPRDIKMSEDSFRSAADEMLDRIQQLADNTGATDEHRALNYLAVRYQQIYVHATEMYAREFSLSSVEVKSSRLSSTRKLVNVIISYTNRNTDVVEKFVVRVDVTEKYPFLDKKLSPYYDRE